MIVPLCWLEHLERSLWRSARIETDPAPVIQSDSYRLCRLALDQPTLDLKLIMGAREPAWHTLVAQLRGNGRRDPCRCHRRHAVSRLPATTATHGDPLRPDGSRALTARIPNKGGEEVQPHKAGQMSDGSKKLEHSPAPDLISLQRLLV